MDNYLTVLDSQRSLYSAQQGVIETRLTGMLNLVALYKVWAAGDWRRGTGRVPARSALAK